MTPLLIITIVFCGIGFLLNTVIALAEKDTANKHAFASNAFLLLMAIVAMAISLGALS